MHGRVNFDMLKIPLEELPAQLAELPQPPEALYVKGAPLPLDGLYLAVVGSRNHSRYGAEACEKLMAGLAGAPLLIVSGLALGIDSVAHKAALKAGLRTIAFPGSGLSDSVIYPAANFSLAMEILDAGGTLVSEFEPGFRAAPFSFPQRNRLMAGLCQAVLIIEAAEKSGTLITARMALDYNRDVLAIPGPITSEKSFGTNRLLRQGAVPITCADDILEAFGLVREHPPEGEAARNLSEDERAIFALLDEPKTADTLAACLGMPIEKINAFISMLEVKGVAKEELGEIRRT